MADEESEGLERIVVGVDGSQPSKSALRWAALIAQATGATVQAVIAWEYPTGLGWAMPPEDWQPELDMRATLEDTRDEVFGPQRPPRLQANVERGAPRTVLLEAARREPRARRLCGTPPRIRQHGLRRTRRVRRSCRPRRPATRRRLTSGRRGADLKARHRSGVGAALRPAVVQLDDLLSANVHLWVTAGLRVPHSMRHNTHPLLVTDQMFIA